MPKNIIAGLRPFQQCFSYIRADMNNEKYIQVMTSRLGLILSLYIYKDVTLLSLCKTNVKISGEISQAYLNYGLLLSLCYTLSSI